MFSIFRYIFSRTILVFSSQHPMNCEKKLFCIRMVTNDIETNNIFWLSLIKHKNILYNLSVYLRQPCHLNTLPSNGMRFIFFSRCFCHSQSWIIRQEFCVFNLSHRHSSRSVQFICFVWSILFIVRMLSPDLRTLALNSQIYDLPFVSHISNLFYRNLRNVPSSCQ